MAREANPSRERQPRRGRGVLRRDPDRHGARLLRRHQTPATAPRQRTATWTAAPTVGVVGYDTVESGRRARIAQSPRSETTPARAPDEKRTRRRAHGRPGPHTAHQARPSSGARPRLTAATLAHRNAKPTSRWVSGSRSVPSTPMADPAVPGRA